MPSKCSQTVRPSKFMGIVSSVRYHHEDAKGLSFGIGKLAKLAPMGYVVPGIFRRFMPKSGSGYVPSATSAATTVDGILVECQAAAGKPGVEIWPPVASNLQDDCNRQPVCSGKRAPGDAGFCAEAIRGANTAKKIEAVRRNRKLSRDRAIAHPLFAKRALPSCANVCAPRLNSAAPC